MKYPFYIILLITLNSCNQKSQKTKTESSSSINYVERISYKAYCDTNDFTEARNLFSYLDENDTCCLNSLMKNWHLSNVKKQREIDLLLWRSLLADNLDFYHFILSKNPNHKIIDREVENAIIYHGDINLYEFAFDSLAFFKNKDNWCLLVCACLIRKDFDLIKLLIDKGTKLDCMMEDPAGETAKTINELAVETNDSSIITLLIKNGIRFNENSLYYAVETDKVNSFKYILNILNPDSLKNEEYLGQSLLVAAENGSSITDFLLKSGADINYLDSLGNNALFYAFRAKPWPIPWDLNDRIPNFKYLLENGININQQNIQGLTPASLLVKKYFPEERKNEYDSIRLKFFEIMDQNKVDYSIKDSTNNNFYDYISKRGSTILIEKYIKNDTIKTSYNKKS